MNTFENMKTVIASNKKTKEELLVLCDVFLMNYRINQDQYTELVQLIG